MRRVLATAVLALSLTALPVLTTPADAAAGWREHDTPSTESLRGLDAVDRHVAWVAGDDGGIFRTTNGGASWRDVSPGGPDPLAFRDVEAFSALSAVVLAIGPGTDSRILRTVDGGRTWATTFVNDDEDAFYDCMDFFPGHRRGLAVSDPVDGKFRVLSTTDGGRSWQVLPSAGMPEAPGEFGFAASGTCLETAGGRDAWIASGGTHARIYHSRDAGRTWTVADQPIAGGDAAGVFSLAFRNARQGVAVGGDFTKEADGTAAAAYTRDGGSTWPSGGDLSGYRSGADWVPGSPNTVLAVGPNGTDVSRDAGRSWSPWSSTGFHAVVCVSDGTCWASGSGGRVAVARHPH